MKQKPDNVRDTEEDILTITKVRKSDTSKPIMTFSTMGQKDKDSRPVSEELPPQTSDVEEFKDTEVGETTGDKGNDLKPANITANLEWRDDEDVASLVEGIKGCVLDPKANVETDGATQDLRERLTRLDLEEGDAKTKRKEVSFTRRQEPEEDDESELLCGPKQEKNSVEPQVGGDDDVEEDKEVRMVKLEAPTKGDEEPKPTESGRLNERSPAGGIPVYPNQNRNQMVGLYPPAMHSGGCLQGNQNAVCDPSTWTMMPDSNCNAQVQQQPIYDPSFKGKRRRNDHDFYADAPKYFLPHTEPQMMSDGGLNNLNNLDAPGQPSNFKSINQVCRRQMSGGTVFTVTANPDPNDGKQPVGGLDSLQEDIDFLTFTGCNFDIGELLQQQDGSTTAMGLAPIQLNCRTHQSALYPSQVAPCHAFDPSSKNKSYSQQQLQCQPDWFQTEKESVARLPVHPGMTSPGKMMAPGDDHGYNSDMSPSHEAQFSSTPSPQSFMEASPTTLGSSPPEQNWSPPPSNLSMLSHDSGVFSPMAEEGTASQVKSPRSIQTMSPESVSQTAINDYWYLVDAVPSLPQQQGGLGANPVAVSPPKYAGSSPTSFQAAVPLPGYDQMAPPQQRVRSALHQPHNLPPCQMAQSPPQPKENAEDYTDPFIDQNLSALSDALAVVTKDLVEESLKRDINLPADSWHEGGPVNIPSTVPQEITSPSFRQAAQPTFQGLTTGSPLAHTGKLPPPNAKKSSPSKKPGAKAQAPPPVPKGAAASKANDAKVYNKFVLGKPVTMSGPAGTLVITSAPALNTTTPPVMNTQGKIAIPALQQKPRPVQGPTPVGQYLLTANGVTLVLPQVKPRYSAIAPKAPSKPSNSKPAEVSSNAKVTCLSGQGQSVQGKIPKRSPSMNDKLNIARRSVAEVERRDLLLSDTDGDTYLHVAVCKADETLIQALLERLVREVLGDMIDAQNVMGQTPLYLAVCVNKPEMVEVLVNYGADVKHFAEATLDNGTREKSAAIHRASSKGEGHLNTLKALLKSENIDLNQMDSEGHTALHCAILNHGKMSTDNKPINSIPVLEALVLAGADPNFQVQKNRKTALMYALETRNLDLIESVFRLIEPSKLAGYLKTESCDGITCHKIASSLKSSLDAASQQRLSKCLKSGSHRADH